MPRGLIVSFSGIDSSGKTTQIELLREHASSRGRSAVYLWGRVGYTGVFSAIKSAGRRLLGRGIPAQGDFARRERALRNRWLRRLWLTLALLDLLRLYALRVRLERLRGRVVVCDRYVWDSLVDLRLGFASDQVERWWLWRLVERCAPRPDVALLFTVPVQESVRRSDLKREPFRETSERLAERTQQYAELSLTAGWQVVDGMPSPEEVFERVLYLLSIVWDDAGDGPEPA